MPCREKTEGTAALFPGFYEAGTKKPFVRLFRINQRFLGAINRMNQRSPKIQPSWRTHQRQTRAEGADRLQFRGTKPNPMSPGGCGQNLSVSPAFTAPPQSAMDSPFPSTQNKRRESGGENGDKEKSRASGVHKKRFSVPLLLRFLHSTGIFHASPCICRILRACPPAAGQPRQ